MRSSGTPRVRGVLSKPSGTIPPAARDSVPKAVLRSSSSSRSKSITSIAIGWFEEERSHIHGQESKMEKEHPRPNLYYSRYSELPTRPSGWPACWDHCARVSWGGFNSIRRNGITDIELAEYMMGSGDNGQRQQLQEGSVQKYKWPGRRVLRTRYGDRFTCLMTSDFDVGIFPRIEVR